MKKHDAALVGFGISLVGMIVCLVIAGVINYWVVTP